MRNMENIPQAHDSALCSKTNLNTTYNCILMIEPKNNFCGNWTNNSKLVRFFFSLMGNNGEGKSYFRFPVVFVACSIENRKLSFLTLSQEKRHFFFGYKADFWPQATHFFIIFFHFSLWTFVGAEGDPRAPVESRNVQQRLASPIRPRLQTARDCGLRRSRGQRRLRCK